LGTANCVLRQGAGTRDRTPHDGARLCQCEPFYERSLDEIADLFDSVYVSFYKHLGATAGATLAATKDVIEEARVRARWPLHPPQTAMCHLLVHRELEPLNDTALDIADRTKTYIGHFAATDVPGVQTTG
jgi:hypothetical protein